jgi:hypothetical protein
MLNSRLAAAVALGIAICSAPSGGAIALATCEDLARTTLRNATVTAAESLPAGPWRPPEGNPVTVAVPFCRVALTLKPSADSDIKTEVWMPVSGWNGKFQGIGNGGFAGSIGYGMLAEAVGRGYAAASTDTGHKTGPGIDASWALGHPEKIKDFGYRAIHETATAGKAVAAAFYSAPPTRSYFNSCSNGGRQALMEAQRFPEDYDGIIAGAPANYWTRLMSMAVVNSQALMADDASYVPASKLPAISAAALAACDTNDEVKDNVIENPAACRFDPAVMLCKDGDNATCLTAPQVTALKKVYAATLTTTGETLMPGYSPGGEAEPGGWAGWITGAAPRQSAMYGFSAQFFSHMVFDNPSWDFKAFTLDRDWRAAREKVGRDLDADSPDLRGFRARGGKLILYHGWGDAAIPAQSTIDYYQKVNETMGRSETTSFVRLYMVPGMQHCGGGAGPNTFDSIGALERWVERGEAPASMIASHSTGGRVDRTRPLCPYPQVAKYRGTGSIDDAANFACVSTQSR